MIWDAIRRASRRKAKSSLFLVFFLLIALTKPMPSTATSLDSAEDLSLLWGPYRPNLYVGLRPRVPNTTLMGLMWSNADNAELFRKNLRHTCEQNEGMAGYGWTSYDSRTGGSHTVRDTVNMVDLHTDFSKSSEDGELSWSLKVRGNVRANGHKAQKTSVIFYISTESEDSYIDCGYDFGNSATQQELMCFGNISSLPAFKVSILPAPTKNFPPDSLEQTSTHAVRARGDQLWQAKSVYLDLLNAVGDNGIALPNSTGVGNMIYNQANFRGDFVMEISFLSLEMPDQRSISSTSLTEAARTARSTFNERFESVYQPQSPFAGSEYRSFSKELLSNLMGGIGFFHGKSKVTTNASAEQNHLTSITTDVEERGPYSLFSAVPSRPFFPRGFLWDEGFHLQIILDWDMDLAMEIVTSWFDLMDDNGWIAREQILGPEARSKVPLEFQTQYQTYANPPTLFLVLDMFIDRALGSIQYRGAPSRYADNSSGTATARSRENAELLLMALYPKMRKHYLWFCQSQQGSLEKYQYAHSEVERDFSEGYRWRGHTSDHILTSGLDDFPRAFPSADELHLDALCWVSLMAQVLAKVSSVLPLLDYLDVLPYELTAKEAARTAAEVHWSEANQAYCDVTITNASIERVCHKGYISLLPLLTNTISASEVDYNRTAAVLDLISSPSQLWTPYGIRSLSAQDPAYGTGEDYWRSPIWVNFNYLILESLLKLAQNTQHPHRDRAKHIYIELRRNIANTVFQSWKETGFAWEQYNAKTGVGQRTQHFTGWTALIVRIMSMPNLSEPAQQNKPFTGFRQPLSPDSWTAGLIPSNGILIFLIGIVVFVGLFFRRRLTRNWKNWLDDR